MKLLVIGAGAAGTAAAWRASQGAQVTVVHAHAGATALGSGALDLEAWGERDTTPLAGDPARFLQELGCWRIAPTAALLVTQSGQPRYARAADNAVLDLTMVAGGRVAVCDLGRIGYQAAAWVRALNASRWAGESGTRFEAVSDVVPAPDAVGCNDYDFAALHDDEGRLRTLGDALAARSGFRAWLLPPALGISQPVRTRLQQRLAATLVGECLSMPGGPAGARFELARDALLTRRSIQVVRGQLLTLSAQSEGFRAEYQSADGASQELTCERVIVACGGIVSGGLRLGAARVDAPRERAFELGFTMGARLPLTLAGELLDDAASLHGFDFAQSGLSALEQVGLHAVRSEVPGCAGLLAAGDVVAGGARATLAAVQSGCLAAERAVRVTA